MSRNNTLFIKLIAPLLGLIFSALAHAQGYSIAPAASWVKSVAPTADNQAQDRNTSNGVDVLLVDRQMLITNGQKSHYHHYTSKAVNTSGVAEISHIAIEFDPSYQEVTLHRITVHRDGKLIEKMGSSQISLIQREEEAEYQIYDGAKTLNILIDDVRVGDTVDYSYTVSGSNPILSGHFSEQLKLRWPVPVNRVYYRLLWSPPHPLYIRNHKTDIQPTKSESAEYTEYVWQQDHAKELVVDSDTPEWFNPFPIVYLSDLADWSQVADWARPLYQTETETPGVRDVITSLLKGAHSEGDRAVSALRFVQDEIRYLGFEMGTRAHKPNAPDAVINQRYGDCKDKARLLVSLLQGMGIDSSVALVDTDNGKRLNELLPTPAAFNHSMVVIRSNGRNYWVDPTRSHQQGVLDSLYQPDYGYALIVAEQGTGLTKMSDDITSVNSIHVEESFDIRNAVDKPASYRVVTQHNRFYADSLRGQLADNNIKQLQQSYLNYTAQYYPGSELADDITIADDATLNRISITENYSIPKIWSKIEDDRYLYADFSPFLINDHIKTVSAPVRTMPFAVSHPVRYMHTTRILAPGHSNFENEFTEIDDDAFHFSKTVVFANGVLKISYAYESRKDHVEPEHIDTYSENIRKVRNLAGYQIQMPNPAFNSNSSEFAAQDINWPVVIIFVLALFGILLISIKYIYLYDPQFKPKQEIDHKLEGLSGWLILPAIALFLAPIKIGVESLDLWFIFSTAQWSILADRFGIGFPIFILVEMILNQFLVIVAVLLIVLFFTRRHTLPQLYIAYLVFNVVGSGADLLTFHLLSFPGLKVEPSDIAELARAAGYTAIWSAYFVKSERVKATFTRHRTTKRAQREYSADAVKAA